MLLDVMEEDKQRSLMSDFNILIGTHTRLDRMLFVLEFR